MNVIIIGAVDPDPSSGKIGGIRTYILNLLSSMKKSGIEITLIGISCGKIIKSNEFKFIPIAIGKKVSSFEFLLKLFIKACYLPISKDSIIHVQRPEDLLPFYIFYPNNPRVCTIHGKRSEKEISDKHGKIIAILTEMLAEFGLKHADKNIVIDERTRNLLIARNPGIENKIVVIPSGVDLALFRQMDKKALRNIYCFKENDRIILYVGRYDKVKGIDLLIKSFKKMQSLVINSKLVLVGTGQEEQNLRDMANGQSNIMFMGPLERLKIPEIMNCADVLALCSLREGMPTVVLEAMACGLPVVSTDVGDVSKVVKNDLTGYIIQSRDEKEVSDALKKVLTKQNGFSQNCINTAKEYSKEKVAESILKVYNEVLHKK